jgi:hypothetical protein
MAEIHFGRIRMHYKNPIVYLVFEESVELGFPEIRDIIKHAETLSNNKPHVILVEIRAKVTLTHEVKRLAYKKEGAPLHRGIAFVVKNKLLPLAADLIKAVPLPHYPCRIFTDKEQASGWLNGVSLDN